MQDNARRHFNKGVRSDDPKCVAGEINEMLSREPREYFLSWDVYCCCVFGSRY